MDRVAKKINCFIMIRIIRFKPHFKSESLSQLKFISEQRFNSDLKTM